MQPRSEQLVPKIRAGLVERGDRVPGRRRTAAQPVDLREDEPDPMAALAAGAQLVEDGVVDPSLRIDKTLQIKGIACGLHMSYRGTVPTC